MALQGYYLLICTCDECKEEMIYRGYSKESALGKMWLDKWKSKTGDAKHMLCPACAREGNRTPTLPLFNRANGTSRAVAHQTRLKIVEPKSKEQPDGT